MHAPTMELAEDAADGGRGRGSMMVMASLVGGTRRGRGRGAAGGG
jgi:hypothetical protein